MKCGRTRSSGFTIVEVLIFLAVSSALLISALTLVSGAQNKTEFRQAADDLQQVINDTINNVATGYYANSGNFASNNTCGVNGAGDVTFTNTGANQGKSKDCIFLGRAIQFTNGEDYYVYNVVGKREVSEGTVVASYAQAKPRLITPKGASNSGFPESSERKKLKNGLSLASLTGASGGVAGVVFLSSLGQIDAAAGGLVSSSQVINFSGVDGSLTDTQDVFVDAFQGQDIDASINPSSGVALCLNSGGTKQHALITLGGNGKQDSSELKIEEGVCP